MKDSEKNKTSITPANTLRSRPNAEYRNENKLEELPSIPSAMVEDYVTAEIAIILKAYNRTMKRENFSSDEKSFREKVTGKNDKEWGIIHERLCADDTSFRKPEKFAKHLIKHGLSDEKILAVVKNIQSLTSYYHEFGNNTEIDLKQVKQALLNDEIEKGSLEGVRLALSRGAEINNERIKGDESSKNSLWTAVLAEDKNMMELLLRNGADPKPVYELPRAEKISVGIMSKKSIEILEKAVDSVNRDSVNVVSEVVKKVAEYRDFSSELVSHIMGFAGVGVKGTSVAEKLLEEGAKKVSNSVNKILSDKKEDAEYGIPRVTESEHVNHVVKDGERKKENMSEGGFVEKQLARKAAREKGSEESKEGSSR